ncbi:MAG: thioredoxin family protein, partial [Pseudomonas aeruginosa]|nr:thioredoxin family protein [Pseudomonas aeruginosa]
MLDANLKTQLKAYLEKVSQPFEIVASLDDSDKSRELLGLLQDIVGLTDKITLKTDGSDARKPSFSLNRPGADIGLRFAGIPMGHEFTSLVLALLQVGGHPSKLDADVIEQVKGIEGTFEFETYFSLSCQNCPDVVQALNLMAVLNPNIRHVAIDGALFQDEVEARQIMSVPSIYLNGEVFGQALAHGGGAPGPGAVRRGLAARQFGQQHAHGQPGVAVDGQARRVVAHQLLRVDVDADQLAIEGEAAVEHHVVVGFARLEELKV